jgi:hypothetical protein
MTANNGPFLFKAVIHLAEPQKAGNRKPTSPHLLRFYLLPPLATEEQTTMAITATQALCWAQQTTSKQKPSSSSFMINPQGGNAPHQCTHMALRRPVYCQRNPGCSVISVSI